MFKKKKQSFIKYDYVNAGQMHANISGCYQLFIQNLPHTIGAAGKTEFTACESDCFKMGAKLFLEGLY